MTNKQIQSGITLNTIETLQLQKQTLMNNLGQLNTIIEATKYTLNEKALKQLINARTNMNNQINDIVLDIFNGNYIK